MRLILLGLCLIVLAGPTGARQPTTTITYKYECCGLSLTPTIYSLTVSSDGSGVFRGTSGTTIIGERTFTVRPADFRNFANLLSRYRPRGGALRNCGETASEGPWVDLDWIGARGKLHAFVDFGNCARLNGPAFEALKNAPLRLGVGSFIDQR